MDRQGQAGNDAKRYGVPHNRQMTGVLVSDSTFANFQLDDSPLDKIYFALTNR